LSISVGEPGSSKAKKLSFYLSSGPDVKCIYRKSILYYNFLYLELSKKEAGKASPSPRRDEGYVTNNS
jgi:hypothetical protein